MKKYNKLKITFILSIFFFVTGNSWGQIPQVPREMRFADLTLKLNEQVRREIQLDVDALHKNPNYFRVKLERVNLYMPIVEKELLAAGVPTDLKYLAIQESSLIPDAVSTSNAVGFWQFKKGTAEEVFLRVDNHIDERKNIVSSTQGAARYLAKNNSQFNNWMCGLIAYQMGLGGAKSYFGTQYNGKKIIELDRNTHWYFKKFLAHKVAFENQIGKLVSNTGYLEEIQVQGPTTLKAIATNLGVSEAHLKEYNKWTSNGNIPDDRPYSVVWLRPGNVPVRTLSNTSAQSNPSNTAQSTQQIQNPADAYPKVTGNTQKSTQADQIKVNNIPAIQASQKTSQEELAEDAGIRKGKLRRVNDLGRKDDIEAGGYYYTKAKNNTAEVETHVVQAGETLWSISQKYGIKLTSLKAKNRIREDNRLIPGMVLNLQDHRKRGEEIPILPRNQQAQKIPTTTNPPTTQTQPPASTNQPNTPANTNIGQTLSHTVAPGENLFRISQRYGVKVDDIKRWNRLSNDNIRVGQKLTINKP
ncbi:LysM peptidoglycan-binding domain-containing protein [Belliella kenyensis]|uniref:LysM peptidoglycan-binding domain-containing protein n=1 Tax=Belliella kenyensis TaxID=1472724 RepID=A0ABV8ES59_9BACT|nr:LysM peptidoglycan-binding domain-containing protein [Belliella kenyensis]MCH7403796.1 LysM peptidoglycan-binding domain-containing protein [Belliella kenyensis]MDN3602420.1 LysM peptidoglycan-binding domain-containing protein [Belliella kenyensis]